MKRLVVLAGMAAVLLNVIACSSQTPGSPTASTNAGGQIPNGSRSESTSSPSSGVGGSLPVDAPCSLLSSSDLRSLGAFAPPSRSDIAGASNCEVEATHGVVEVTLFAGQGLSQVPTTGAMTDVRIGGHQAKKMVETASGGCYVGIGVTSSSRVDVTVNADHDDEACPLAMKAAGLVEPHLPAAG